MSIVVDQLLPDFGWLSCKFSYIYVQIPWILENNSICRSDLYMVRWVCASVNSITFKTLASLIDKVLKHHFKNWFL